MNSVSKYRLKTRQKAFPPYSEPFSMKEFMLFSDTQESKRFVLPKFRNHVSEVIHRMEMEMTQTDMTGIGIRKARYIFENLNVGPFENAVFPQKIEVDGSCENVSVKLLRVESDQKIWTSETGEWRKKDPDQQISLPISSVFGKETKMKRRRLSLFVFLPLGMMALFVFTLYVIFTLLNR